MKKVLVMCMSLLLTVSLVGCSSTPEASGPEGTLEEIITAIYEANPIELSVETMPFDTSDSVMVKMFTGLDSSDLISEFAVSESMMGAQAYSLVLVRLNDANDAQTVVDEMKAGIDPRKWICVEADDLQVVASGDVVMLTMMSTEFKDSVTTQDMVDAFSELSGGLSIE